MKRKQVLIGMILVCLIVIVSCNTEPPSVLPTPISAITEPATSTATVFLSPTWTSTAEPSPVPTDTPPTTPSSQPTTTPCPTPTPGGPVGQILLSAVECAGRSCEPFDGDVAPIYLINSDGSGMRQIYEGIGVIGDLHLSPDGTKLTFADSYGRGVSNVYVLDLISGHAWFLVPDDTSEKVWGPRWVSNNKLVFIKIDGMNSSTFQSNLYLANVDGARLQQLTDRPPRTRIYNVSVSPDGAQLLFAEFLLDSNVTTAYRMNIDGTELIELITFPEVNRVDVSWSPTGDRLVVYPIPITSHAEYVPVYVAESDDLEMTEIASVARDPGDLELLGWTEDQRGLVFYMCSGFARIIQVLEVQSDGNVYPRTTSEGAIHVCSFGKLSPDRKWFAFSPSPSPGLYVMDMYGGCPYQILSGYRVQSILWLPEDTFLQPVQQ